MLWSVCKSLAILLPILHDAIMYKIVEYSGWHADVDMTNKTMANKPAVSDVTGWRT